jgi:hypothetical protein
MRWSVDWIREFNLGDVFYVRGVLFLGEDTWVPPEVNAGFLGPYEGRSIAPDVDFELQGYQTSEYVWVTGHYEQYDLLLSMLPTFA